MSEPDMKHLPLRIWLMVTLTLALAPVIIRFVWEITINSSVASLVILIPVILTIVGIYALALYLLIAPSKKKLRSLPVLIGVIVVFTAGLIGSIIHYIRFVPPPEAAAPLSVVMATLLIAAAISGYILILWVIWSFWKGRIG